MIRIKKGRIIRYKIPFIKPFTVSFGTLYERETIILELEGPNGNVGYGEAPAIFPPLYNHETHNSIIFLIKEFLFHLIKNKPISKPEIISQIFKPIKGNQFAKSALETAFYDLWGKKLNKRIVDLIKAKKNKLITSATVSIYNDVNKTLEEVKKNLEKGYVFIKLKIKPNYDLEFIKKIKKKFPNINLMIDANSSYVLGEKTIKIFKEIDKYNLYSIEQPLQSDDIVDHAKLQKQIKTKIALDESIESVYDIEKAIELGSLKLLNIKIPRVGGFFNSLKINEICKKNKIKTWVGGMFESPVGFYSNLTLACQENFDLPVDFIGGFNFLKDYEKFFIKKPFSIERNHMYVNLTKSGFGLEINWRNFNRYKVEVINLI